MPSVLLQKGRHDQLRGYLITTSPPWRLGPFDAAECEAFSRLCDDPELCRLLAAMLRPCWGALAALLMSIASDELTRLRLVDEFAAAADALYAVAESFDSATNEQEQELPAPNVRIAGAIIDGLTDG